MVKVGVVGATGYTGEVLVKLLAGHPQVKLVFMTAKVDKEESISKIYPSLKNRCDLICKNLVIEDVLGKADLVFLALPHRVSMEFAPLLLRANSKVIDLSADYRLPKDLYKIWYGTDHKDESNIDKAVYGLPELYRGLIKKASLIANPGCYPTSIILGLAPLVSAKINDPEEIIIADSKSGVTGAGRKADLSISFSEVNESLKAYKINEHQHMPEIAQEVSKVAASKLEIVFVPHLIPMNRGILSTIYVRLAKKTSTDELLGLYNNFYGKEKFIRVLDKGKFPEIKDVVNTNMCAVGVKVDEKKNLAVIVSCIDNLLKGAAGQAVQNMNVMYNLDETLGLL